MATWLTASTHDFHTLHLPLWEVTETQNDRTAGSMSNCNGCDSKSAVIHDLANSTPHNKSETALIVARIINTTARPSHGNNPKLSLLQSWAGACCFRKQSPKGWFQLMLIATNYHRPQQCGCKNDIWMGHFVHSHVLLVNCNNPKNYQGMPHQNG